MNEGKATQEKTTKPFVHLHVHSEYSLLDGAARIKNGKHSPLLEACAAKGMPGCALTDHGNMFGAYTFYKTAKDHGIKPIVGCEFYVCPDMHATGGRGEFQHLVLLAKTTAGYRNIVKMDSLAYVEGFYYKPRIDMELLRRHTEGVVCLSACLSGRIPSLLAQNDYEGAKAYALELKSLFSEGDFYIELQDHGIPEQRKINPLLVKLAREIGVKTVATNDVHYIEREDAEMHDVLLCIQTGKTLEDEARMRFDSDQFYLKSYEEMAELFSWCPEAVTNTLEVMDKCNIEIKREDLFPPYVPEDGSTAAEFLRKIAYEGLEKRYGVITDEIRERAEYELDIIIRMGFAEYYLIVWDFIRFALEQGIPVGAGRGSGVSSIIAYAIHITNVEPLRYNLLFERFLNPERISAPDFDIDFCMDRRGEVIDYVIRKYGADKVCQILALTTMKAKGAIKDVARVYNVPLDIVNKTTKPIPNDPKISLEKVLGRITKEEDKKYVNPEVIEIYETNDDMRRVIDMALKIEGMPRNCSKHAAGVVICKEVISDFVPLQRNGSDITTQFQKEEVEELGMLKMDFLGLTTLTDISKAKQYIRETTGEEVDFEKLGYDDPEVYKLIGSGETDAVFQLESAGMKRFMKDLKPESLEDVIAGISLYRPGPMDSIDRYVEAKNKPETIFYDHPMLEPILKMTYGCLVYQEQVMQIVQQLGGYSLGRADLLRRAMGKKKPEIMNAERVIFVNGAPAKPEEYYPDGSLKSKAEPAVDGAIKRGVPEAVANKIFDDMVSFASYAFNKSHAAAYAVLAYETAYLKRYHLVELVAAVINDRITNADEIAKYLSFLRDNGKEVLPPDVNRSDYIFRVENGALRFGLNGIKNVGEAATIALVEERKARGPYKSMGDIFDRLPTGTLNKKAVESLIKAGALDCFGYTRASLMASYEGIMNLSSQDKKMAQTGQLSLFGLIEEEKSDPVYEMKEYERGHFLAMEKEVLNIYISGHPLENYRDTISKMDFNLSHIKELLSVQTTDEGEETVEDNSAQLAKEYHGRNVLLGGMLSGMRKNVTKTGRMMAYGILEDLYGSIEAVFFPSAFDRFKRLLENDNVVLINGKLNTMGDRINIAVNDIRLWENPGERAAEAGAEEASQEPLRKLYVKMAARNDLGKFRAVAELYPGETPVVLQFDGKLYGMDASVDVNDALLAQFAAIAGDEKYVKIR